MTQTEIIKLLKSNEKAFYFLPEEVKEWAEEHKGERIWNILARSTIKLAEWRDPESMNFNCPEAVYRLISDYPEESEPKEIVLPIVELQGMLKIYTDRNGYMGYTNAPALIPAPGFYFAGFRYESGLVVPNECMRRYQYDEPCVRPIEAVYRP